MTWVLGIGLGYLLLRWAWRWLVRNVTVEHDKEGNMVVNVRKPYPGDGVDAGV